MAGADQRIVPVSRLRLKGRRMLSPPWLAEPLYGCATAVTVYGFVPHAELTVQVGGAVAVTAVAGFPEPQGATLALPAPLAPGQSVRVRQRSSGISSAWSAVVTVRDHTQDYPAGPPRPQVNPAPVFRCGVRTGVGNLLAGGNVWITADAVEVGRVNGCAPQQGVNVAPPYGLGQHVRAWFELCGDPSPPSLDHVTQTPPAPPPAPGIDPVYEGGEQVRITNVVNGARVTLYRGGVNQGTWGCWGGALLVGLPAPFSAGETLSATQAMCPGDPSSPPGTVTVVPCSFLPAPGIGPVDAGDNRITVATSVPGATIRVYVNGVLAGVGSAPQVLLNATVRIGDTIHVIQDVGNLPGLACTGGQGAVLRPAGHLGSIRPRFVPGGVGRVHQWAGSRERVLPGGGRRAGAAVQLAACRGWACADRRHGSRQPFAGRSQLPRLRLLSDCPGSHGDDRRLRRLQRVERCRQWRPKHRGSRRPDHRLDRVLPSARR